MATVPQPQRPALGPLGVGRLFALCQDGINGVLSLQQDPLIKNFTVSSGNISVNASLDAPPIVEFVISESGPFITLLRLHIKYFKSGTILAGSVDSLSFQAYNMQMFISCRNNTINLTQRWEIVLEGPSDWIVLENLEELPSNEYRELPIQSEDSIEVKLPIPSKETLIAAILTQWPIDPSGNPLVTVISAGTSTGIDPAIQPYIDDFTKAMCVYWKALATNHKFDLGHFSFPFPEQPKIQFSPWTTTPEDNSEPDPQFAIVPGGLNQILVYITLDPTIPDPSLQANWYTHGNNGAMWLSYFSFHVDVLVPAINGIRGNITVDVDGVYPHWAKLTLYILPNQPPVILYFTIGDVSVSGILDLYFPGTTSESNPSVESSPFVLSAPQVAAIKIALESGSSELLQGLLQYNSGNKKIHIPATLPVCNIPRI